MARSLIAALANHLRRRGACFAQSMSERGGGTHFSSRVRPNVDSGGMVHVARGWRRRVRPHHRDSLNRHGCCRIGVPLYGSKVTSGLCCTRASTLPTKSRARGKDWHVYHGFSFLCAALVLERNIEFCSSVVSVLSPEITSITSV